MNSSPNYLVVQDNIPNLCQYNNCDLILEEKINLVTWQKSLVDCAVTGMMVNSFLKIVSFEQNCKENDI